MSSIATYASAQAQSQSRTRTSSVSKGRYALIGLATIIASALANVLFYYLADIVVRYDPDFVVLTNPSGVAIFTAAAAIVAVLLYAGLRRFTARPERNFTIVSVVVLIVSIVPDLTYIPTVEGASNGQTAVLILTHLVAAAVITPMLIVLSRSRGRNS